ncbi:MAG: dUTP diphosphatase [Clostridia bacterium]|nr:dUTP diphosphatase [Clostridia bacterium]
MNCSLPVTLLRPGAVLPTYATPGAAALDLCAAPDVSLTLNPGASALVPTGLAVAIPQGYVGLLFARSGLAVRQGLCLANGVGVIDSDYRGELCVALLNLGEQPISITGKMRIAQLALLPVAQAALDLRPSLDSTQRGAGGFGSTGVAPLEPEVPPSGRKGGL